MNQFKGLPHSGRDGLGGECAAIDDLKDFVIKIIKLILQGHLDDRHEDSLDVEQDIRSALKSEDQGTNSLQDTKGSDALVIVFVVKLAIIANLALFLEKLTNDPHVGISELFAESHCEGGELSSKNLDKILHDVCEGIDIGFVGELEKLLHDGRDILLHARSDDVVSDERLKSERSSDTDGEGRIGHAVQDVSVDSEEIVLILEVKLLKFLDGVASASTEITLGASKVRENITNKEVFNLVRNGALFTQNNRSQGSNHAQGTLLSNVVLLVIFGLLILVDNGVDKLKDLESLLAAVLGEVDEEVCGCDVRSGRLFEVVELSVKILIRLILELLDILLGKAEDGEDEVSDQVGKVRLQVCPHLLWTD